MQFALKVGTKKKMEAPIRILFIIVCIAVVVGLNVLFWRMQTWAVHGHTAFPVLAAKGCVAGLTGWTWMIPMFSLIGMDTPTGYTISLAWFYLVFLVPFIGMLFTGFIWCAINLRDTNPGIFARLLIGLGLGLIVGAVFGGGMAISNPYTAKQSMSAMIFYCTILGSAAGIMARR